MSWTLTKEELRAAVGSTNANYPFECDHVPDQIGEDDSRVCACRAVRIRWHEMAACKTKQQFISLVRARVSWAGTAKVDHDNEITKKGVNSNVRGAVKFGIVASVQSLHLEPTWRLHVLENPHQAVTEYQLTNAHTGASEVYVVSDKELADFPEGVQEHVLAWVNTIVPQWKQPISIGGGGGGGGSVSSFSSVGGQGGSGGYVEITDLVWGGVGDQPPHTKSGGGGGWSSGGGGGGGGGFDFPNPFPMRPPKVTPKPAEPAKPPAPEPVKGFRRIDLDDE